MRRLCSMAVMAVAAGSTSVYAQSNTPAKTDKPSTIESSISLGYIATDGNSETQTFTGEFTSKWDLFDWTHNFKLQANGSSDKGDKTAERYYAELKSDYNINQREYLYAKGSLTDDRFSGYDYQASASGGYGRYFLKNETFTLQAYGGLGYRKNEVLTGLSDGENIMAIGERFSWKISEGASVKQNFDTEIGDELTITTFEVALQSILIKQVSTKISYRLQNNSKVIDDRENTDTTIAISLVYDF